jgi:hypothetical protein
MKGKRVFVTFAFVILLARASAEAATVAADYQLQDVLTSSVGSIGPLNIVGTASDAAFQSDTVNGQTQEVLTFQTGFDANTGTFNSAGVQTQTNPYLSSTTYSIVLLAKFQLAPTDPIATKILDFKNLSSDDGVYVNSDGTMAFNGVTPLPVGGTPVPPATYVQIVLTRDGATGLVSAYQNGVLAFQFTDSAGQAVLGDATASGNSFLTLFIDDATGVGSPVTQENTVGSMARLRLYDGVLSAEEVAALDTVVPEPATWTLMISGAALLLVRLRKRR